MHLSPRLIYKGILIASVMTMVITVTPRLVRAAEFNPNLIISDAELLDAGTMSLADIQQFLESHGSYLANYRGEDYYGTVRSAAEIIRGIDMRGSRLQGSFSYFCFAR